MKQRKQQYIADKNTKFWETFYVVTGSIGMILLVFEIFIFRKTIIDAYIPISIILIVGLLTFYFNKQHYNKIYLMTGNFFPIMQNIVSWGFISCYIFMATNYYLAGQTIAKYRFEIKEKSSMPGSKGRSHERKPLVKFTYFEFEKELVFQFEDTEKVYSADSVILSVRKGGLGFDIMEDYDVLE